jgi:hypothetical protein
MTDQTRWRATVRYASTAPITDDQADALTAHLPGYAVVILDDRGLQLQMTVEASTLRRATDEALKAARVAFGEAFDVVGEPVAVDVLTEQAYDTELANPQGRDLVGLAEIAEMGEFSKQRAGQVAELITFPGPLAELKQGKVWTRESVARFFAGWQRKGGRPRKTPTA